MQAAILHATAEISAAPRPLPSSDWMKVMSQFGVSSRTMLWNLSWKLCSHKKTTKTCTLVLLGAFISHYVSFPSSCKYKVQYSHTDISSSHRGCSLYTEPSTPTVILRASWLRRSLMRLMTPASPAPHIWAARVDTRSHARRTMSQSSSDGRTPSVLRMLKICFLSPESLGVEIHIQVWLCCSFMCL